jgi:thiol-disulfide isomerase/thioredoxin
MPQPTEKQDIAQGVRILKRLRRFARARAQRGHPDSLVNFNRLKWSESKENRALVSQPLTSDETKAQAWLRFLQDLDPINRNSMFLSSKHPAGGNKWVLVIRIPDFYMVRVMIFTLNGCGACERLHPELEKMMGMLHEAIGAGKLPRDVFASILVDRGTANRNVDLYQRYGVRSFPTMLVLLEEPSTKASKISTDTGVAKEGSATAIARWNFVPGWSRQAGDMFKILEQSNLVRRD